MLSLGRMHRFDRAKMLFGPGTKVLIGGFEFRFWQILHPRILMLAARSQEVTKNFVQCRTAIPRVESVLALFVARETKNTFGKKFERAHRIQLQLRDRPNARTIVFQCFTLLGRELLGIQPAAKDGWGFM